MQKHIRKAIAISFAILSTVAQAENQEVSSQKTADNIAISHTNIEDSIPISYLDKYLSTEEINYSTSKSISQYTATRKHEYNISNLSKYISSKYRVNHDEATQIVNASLLESNKHNLDPMLILSIVGVESTYKKNAKSHKGAVGLTQVIPRYHRAKISDLKKDNLDLWSIKGNIRVAAQILKEYINISKGNIQKALQMYNGSTKDKNFRYSKKVLKKMDKLKHASTSL